MLDSSNRNVLHHAVLKEHGEFIKKFVQLDGDQRKLRDQKDIKGKTP